MAQRGCEACPDIDATSRQQVVTADGGTAYYHLQCVPRTANNTEGLHPRAVQYVHAREQARGHDEQGYSLGAPGEVRAQGELVPLEEIVAPTGALLRDWSAELYAAEQ